MMTERSVSAVLGHSTWHPRGEQTWPEWRSAVPGVTRVQNVRTGMCGTFARWPTQQRKGAPLHAVIDWDSGSRGRVVAYAWDLRSITEGMER